MFGSFLGLDTVRFAGFAMVAGKLVTRLFDFASFLANIRHSHEFVKPMFADLCDLLRFTPKTRSLSSKKQVHQ